MDEKTLKAFMLQTKKSKGCLIWTGPRFGPDGYGIFKMSEIKMLAHRAMWMHENGLADPKNIVFQTCKNKGCVSIEHLEERDAPRI